MPAARPRGNARPVRRTARAHGVRRRHAGPVEQRHRETRPDRPDLVGRGEPRRKRIALEPGVEAERQVGKVRGTCDADPRVRGRDAAFGGGDVRPAFEQRRRESRRNRRHARQRRNGRQRERRRGFPDECRDRMLVERATRGDVGRTRLGERKLRLRTRNVGPDARPPRWRLTVSCHARRYVSIVCASVSASRSAPPGRSRCWRRWPAS